jgi:outer membrane immunogenic protein
MSLEGYLLGVQAGIDLPMSDSVVLGLVGDVSWANIAGDSCVEQTDVTCSEIDQTGHSRLEANIDWLATLRARLGVDVGGVLLYGTAGVAMADVSATVTNYDGTNDADGSASHYGYAVGVGADFDVADNLTVGVEYLYVDLGAADYSFDAPVGDVGSASLTSNILRASVKMHF